MAKNQIDASIINQMSLNLEPRSTLPNAFNSDEVIEVQWLPTVGKVASTLEAHREWLESDSMNGQKADLSGANLREADLSDASLPGADLSDAILPQADLSGADLQRANLSGAKLVEANLSGAHLKGADLSKAALTGADLSKSYLDDTDLSEAGIWEADLSESTLYESDLSKSGLKGADLREAYVYGSNLSGSGLQSANLTGANLADCDLSGALIEDADLSGADLTGANLSEASILNADLSGATLTEANLSRAHLTNADLSECLLDDAILENTKGLQARQLRGSNVSLGMLPVEIKSFEGLELADRAARSAQRLFISVLVACTYATLAITLESSGSQGVPLPIVGMPMEIGPFYLVTPVLLVLLFGYFHLQMQRLWDELAQLPAIFPDGKPLDEKIHPWLVTGLVRGHTRLLKEMPSPPFFPLQYGVGLLLAWGTVPITLIYFAGMYSPGPDPVGSLFLHVLTGLTLVGGIVAYRKATRTLELREHRPIALWKSESHGNEKWVFESAGFWGGVALLIAGVFVWYLRLYGFSLP